MPKIMKSLATGLLVTYQDFDVWAEELRQAFLSVGCVQTSWSGQMTPFDTTTALPQSHAYHGYFVFEINDSYSSEKPIFIKVELGSSNFTNVRTKLAGVVKMTIGFGDVDDYGNATTFNTLANISTGNTVVIWQSSSVEMAWKSPKIILSKTDRALVVLPNICPSTYGTSADGDNNIVGGSGYFCIERHEDGGGNVDTGSFDVIWSHCNLMYGPLGGNYSRANWIFSKHVNVDVINGPSAVINNGFSLPPTTQTAGLLVASPYNKTSPRSVGVSKNLIAINSTAQELAWTVAEFSLDDITAQKYLLIPTMGLTAASLSALPLGVVLDNRSNGGFLGVIWDD